MIRIGEVQDLQIVKRTDFGVYVGDEQERVLLPRKQVPENAGIGDTVTVFIYRDSQDRLLATTRKPMLVLGQVARLEVKDTGKIGAFLDWGLEKDLFLPFKEQTYRVRPGDSCLVALYIDKSSRLCATMNVYKYLKGTTQYKRGDMVQGTAYQYIEKFGMYVAVDDMYQGLIPLRRNAMEFSMWETHSPDSGLPMLLRMEDWSLQCVRSDIFRGTMMQLRYWRR